LGGLWKEGMNTTFKRNWLAGIVILSSLLIILIVIGITIALMWTIHPDPMTGVTDTTVENVTFIGARYIALPCGILNVVAGIFTWSRGLLKKMFTTAGILIGVLAILIGLLAWAWFIMVSSLVF
jgi:hypothetical protein